MKIYALKYEGASFFKSFNIGDDIQSIAAARLLPRLDGFLARDHLDKVMEPCIVSMNGFFMGEPNWPPSPYVIPIFFAFHIAPNWEKVICSSDGIRYLKEHQPIGCRDRGTVDILKKYGVDAYYSGCVTLTFDRRDESPKNGHVFIVGGASKGFLQVVPKAIRNDAFLVNQSKIELPYFPHSTKQEMARQLLNTYREKAKLVITSKIHCAMPCLAMGIPVIFLYDKRKRNDYRVETIGDYLPIHYVGESFIYRKFINRVSQNGINWSPPAVDIEFRKMEIRSGYQAALNRAIQSFSARFGSSKK